MFFSFFYFFFLLLFLFHSPPPFALSFSFFPVPRAKKRRRALPSTQSFFVSSKENDAAAASASLAASAAPPPQQHQHLRPFGFLLFLLQQQQKGPLFRRFCRGRGLALFDKCWCQRSGKMSRRFRIEKTRKEGPKGAGERRGVTFSFLFFCSPRTTSGKKMGCGKKNACSPSSSPPSGPHPNRRARRGPAPRVRVDHQRCGRASVV